MSPVNFYNIPEIGGRDCVSSYNYTLNNPAIPCIF